jgi:predicted nuclease of predicted toxin-antitoxin system
VALQAAGHDVVWIRLEAPGAADADVLNSAALDRRILLTFDKDFGELAGRSSRGKACGVILLRIPPPRSAESGRLLADLIGARTDWLGHFSVIEPGRVRMRPIAG